MPGPGGGATLRSCPGYLSFWTASTVSEFGSQFTTLAIQVLIVVNLHGGATDVGLVNAARWLPYLLFGLIAGVLVDRSRHRPLLVTTDLGCGLLMTLVSTLALTHHLGLATLMVAMTLFGTMTLLNDSAFQAVVPSLVPPPLLTDAHARLDQSAAVAQTSGPALAGALVAAVGAPWAIFVDAMSYLTSGLLMLRIPSHDVPSRPESVRSIRVEAVEGLRWVYRHATLRPFALSTHLWFFCMGVASAVLVPFALGPVGLGPFGLGLALAIGGVGGLLGSLAATRLGARFGAGRVVVLCRVVDTAAFAIIALSTDDWLGWIVFGIGQFVLGLGMGAANANEMGYRQSVTPAHLQGRMNATMRSINRAMIVISAPLGGLLGDAIGLRTMLWIAAGGFLSVAVWLGASPFRNVRIDASAAPS
jgi:MFS family permease